MTELDKGHSPVSRRKWWIIGIIVAVSLIAGGTVFALRDRIWPRQPITAERNTPVAGPTPGSTITVYSFRYGNDSFVSSRWVAADVQYCVAGVDNRGARLGWSTWQWINSQGQRFSDFSSAAPSTPQPAYPTSEVVRNGECVRGWISARVNTSLVKTLRYTHDDLVINWDVPS